MKKEELRFIYNTGKKTDREAYAMVLALSRYYINEMDVQHNKLTNTQLVQLANDLNVNIDGLFDTESDYYSEKIVSISDSDKLTMLNTDMTFLKTPILVRKDGVASFLKVPSVIPDAFK